MRKPVFIIGVAALILLFGLNVFSWGSKFEEKSIYITPQIGLNSWAIPFGAHVEYGLKKKIGIGIGTMFWIWSEELWTHKVINPTVDVAYHFDVKVENLDMYTGAGLGVISYSWKWKGTDIFVINPTYTSGIYFFPFIGGRYYFSPKTAFNLRIGGILGNWGGFGTSIGISFVLPH